MPLLDPQELFFSLVKCKNDGVLCPYIYVCVLSIKVSTVNLRQLHLLHGTNHWGKVAVLWMGNCQQIGAAPACPGVNVSAKAESSFTEDSTKGTKAVLASSASDTLCKELGEMWL